MNRGRGRPPVADPRTTRVVVRVTPAEAEAIHARAEGEGVSTSDLLRGLSVPRQVVGTYLDIARVAIYARHRPKNSVGEDGVDRPIALDLFTHANPDLVDAWVRLSVAEAQGLVDELQLRIREATP